MGLNPTAAALTCVGHQVAGIRASILHITA